MAKRRSLNRKRSSNRRSTGSVGSVLLDPDTDIVDEEQTFWWNNLQDNTFPRPSLARSVNETARQLSVNSRILDSSQSSSEWWNNLESQLSDSEPAASASPRRNLSAAIVKTNILQTSTSESEKEQDLRKRKVHLRAANSRKSIINAFSSALNDTEAAVPLKLRKKGASSNFHSDSDRGVSRERLQEDEHDDSLSPTEKILKPKPHISRKSRGDSTKDQNPFQDILTEDGALNGSTTRRSVALEKESSKRSMHRNIDMSKEHVDDQRKSMRASRAVPRESIETESNANQIGPSSDESIEIAPLKPKSRFIQRARKSVGKNAFADALADGASFSASDPNKEKDIQDDESPLMPSSLSPSKGSVNRSRTKIDTHENSPTRRSSKSSLNAEKKQSLDVPVQAEDNIEADSSRSSLEHSESRRKKSVFLGPKSRGSRKSSTKNPYEEVFEEDGNISARKSNVSTQGNVSVQIKDNIEAISSSLTLDNNEPREKSSVFLKPKSRILASLRKSLSKNPFEEILEEDDNISTRKSNVSTEDNRASLERDETATRISQVHGSLSPDNSFSQSKRNRTTEEPGDIPLTASPIPERAGSYKFNVSAENKSKLSENSDASKSISRKNIVAKTPEKEASFIRKSTREETLKEHTRTNAILTAGSTNTREKETSEISDDSRDDTDNSVSSLCYSSQDSFERVSKSGPDKEGHLTRNTLRNRSETPKSANIGVHDVITNSHNDASRKRGSSVPKRLFKSSPGKETRLMRNSLRNRFKVLKSAKVVLEDIGSLHNDTNREHDSSTPKRLSKSSPAKEARLTRNSLRNQSETPKRTNVEVHEAADNSDNDANREHDSSIPKRLSKSSPVKEARLTRNSLRNRSETPKSASKDMKRPNRSINWIADLEEDNVNADSEMSIGGVSQIISSTRISGVIATIGTHKSTIQSIEVETADGEDADSRMQITQQNSTSTKAETSGKSVNRQSVQSSNRTSIKEGKETAGRQKSLSKSQNYRTTSVRAPSKGISSNASKQDSPKKLRRIDDFFKVKQASTTMDKSSERAPKSQNFDAEKMEKIKAELEKIKNREMAAMKKAATDKKEAALKAKQVKSNTFKQPTKNKPVTNNTKGVDKAFLVNGKVYKAPRLPRPKYWATDRLYKFLWKRMESKYKLTTRVKSEKFVQELAKIVSLIERRKNYENYKIELEALMKEMARLGIISTRNDFYHFCQDFLPYEFRVKAVPMLMPGNKNNIPYDPEKLHIPLLDT